MEDNLVIKLEQINGAICSQVFASIEPPSGALWVYGIDTGDLPDASKWGFGDDVRYYLVVDPKEKEKVKDTLLELLSGGERQFHPQLGASDDENLLKLLFFFYQGMYRSFDLFKDLLEKKGIKHAFWWG